MTMTATPIGIRFRLVRIGMLLILMMAEKPGLILLRYRVPEPRRLKSGTMRQVIRLRLPLERGTSGQLRPLWQGILR
jgi:hypothetical protein